MLHFYHSFTSRKKLIIAWIKIKLSFCSNVDDIDLFVGGMGEKPVPGGLIGPTFACIIGQTFADLRIGDRLWYEAPNEMSSFSQKQLEQVQHANLARLMCDNLEGVITVTKFPMRAHNTHK